jgi:transcriptional regulator with XRE-family HTH domain
VTAGELLREARRRHHLTQAQLAARARTSQAAISRIERELVSPTIAYLAELLDLMGEHLVLSTAPIDYGHNRTVLRENLTLTPTERIDQGVLLDRLLRGETPLRFPRHTTLHLEIARILNENGNAWMTTREVADAVNRAKRYRRRVPGIVTPYQVHGRTKNYDEVFERKGARVRLRSGSKC